MSQCATVTAGTKKKFKRRGAKTQRVRNLNFVFETCKMASISTDVRKNRTQF